jgi:hypothetical protein
LCLSRRSRFLRPEHQGVQDKDILHYSLKHTQMKCYNSIKNDFEEKNTKFFL